MVARHRVSPQGEDNGAAEQAQGWPTADWSPPSAPEQPGRLPEPGVLARAGAVMVRPRSIRAKLIRILVVSLTLVLVLLGFLLTQEATNFQNAGNTSKIVTEVLRVQDLVHELQQERALTNGLLGGGTQFQAQIAPQRALTDTALNALRQTLSDTTFAASGADQVRTALGKLNGLAVIRKDIDQDRAQDAPTFAFYSDAILALNALDLGLDQAQDDPLRHGLQALYALGDIKEFAGQEQGLLSAVFAQNHASIDNYTKFAEVLGQKQAGLAAYDAFATPPERALLDGALQSGAADQAVGFEGIAIAGASGTLPSTVDPVAWSNAMTTVIDRLRDVQQSVGQDITARANSLRDTATTLLIAFSILAVLTVGAMVALVVGAARSVIGPLGMLAREADDVSSRRLPETVAQLQTTEAEVPRPAPVTAPSGAATEIKLVATALDRVQNTALILASEQALIRRNTTASLANLGRRNQNLVRRQLSLISEFEREELDPGALANMFELDHLATRMRRNAESLLVLVGETSPRPWSEPLPVADVIRAALSEVEEYRRVVLRRVDEAWVTGAAVAEVAHMLAELVENGLSFSSPDLEVEIYGRKTGNRYLLAVVDYGIGMPREELERAKARLRDEENFLVAPTRFLGHYVVGRLARQLSVQVELAESPVTGITARMLLPADLLADNPHGGDRRQDTGPGRGRNGATRPAPRPLATPLAASADPAVTTLAPVRSGRGTAPVAPAATAEPEHAPDHTAAGHGSDEVHWPTEQDAATSTTDPGTTTSTPANGLTMSTSPESSTSSTPDDLATTAVLNGLPTLLDTTRVPRSEYTRNGLVKRQPRHRGGNARPPASTSQPRHTAPDNPGPATTVDRERSPNDVGAMLSAFRRGHQRGEQTIVNGKPSTHTPPAWSQVAHEEEPGDH